LIVYSRVCQVCEQQGQERRKSLVSPARLIDAGLNSKADSEDLFQSSKRPSLTVSLPVNLPQQDVNLLPKTPLMSVPSDWAWSTF
jgi:hypothetical protein